MYWPDEGDFFHGEVAGYEPRSGLHTIFYEDGDVEEVHLASERFEWIAAARHGVAAAGGAPEQEGQGRRLVRKAAGGWPQAGDLLWGRVKVRNKQRHKELERACSLHASVCVLLSLVVTPPAGTRVVARPGCGERGEAARRHLRLGGLLRPHLWLGDAERLPAFCREL